jgi:hypothetical protein
LIAVANTKITELTQLTNPVSTDVLPIVDVGADVTKKISIADLLKNASAGTAAAPGIAFDGDTNTGIYSPGSDQVALATGGTGRLFVDASGRVGVSTASPGVNLDVATSGTVSIRAQTTDTSGANVGQLVASYTGGGGGTASSVSLRAGDSYSILTATTNNPLLFATNNTERMRLDSSGRLGLGTSDPKERLDITGGPVLTKNISYNANQNAAYLIAGSTSYTGATTNWGTYGLQHRFKTDSGGIPRVTIDSSTSEMFCVVDGGRVGIGSNNPDSDLHLLKSSGGDVNVVLKVENSTTGQAQLHISAGSDATNRAARINFYNRVSSTSTPRWSIINDIGQNGTNGLSIVNAAGNTALNISQTGNVGINTASPNQPLHVVGNARFTASLLWAGSGATNSYLDGNTTSLLKLGINDRDRIKLNATEITFNDATSEFARIDSSGRLLVGTSTSISVGARLQVRDDATGVPAEFLKSSDDALGPAIYLSKSRGTVGTPTELSNGDTLGYLFFRGYDGAAWQNAASITAIADGTWTDGGDTTDNPGALVFSTTADGASSPTQAMVIKNSQDILMTTSTAATSSTGWYGLSATSSVGSLSISRNGSNVLAFFHTSNASGISGAPVGTVSITTTATTYATSSDYRLKENVVPLTGAIDRINKLKPSQFNFIADPDKTVDGFIAHDAQEVVPECATGTKDEVDADGNPVYQGIDQSKLVPLLTAALQEALQKIEVLEQRLTDAGIA